MTCMSQNFRLFHVSNLSVRNFRIFLLMYPGSVSVRRSGSAGTLVALSGRRRAGRSFCRAGRAGRSVCGCAGSVRSDRATGRVGRSEVDMPGRSVVSVARWAALAGCRTLIAASQSAGGRRVQPGSSRLIECEQRWQPTAALCTYTAAAVGGEPARAGTIPGTRAQGSRHKGAGETR